MKNALSPFSQTDATMNSTHITMKNEMKIDATELNKHLYFCNEIQLINYFHIICNVCDACTHEYLITHLCSHMNERIIIPGKKTSLRYFRSTFLSFRFLKFLDFEAETARKTFESESHFCNDSILKTTLNFIFIQFQFLQ